MLFFVLYKVHYVTQFEELRPWSRKNETQFLPASQRSSYEKQNHYIESNQIAMVERFQRVFKWPLDIVDLQARILKMGYIAVVQDLNVECIHCSELTLLRYACES